MNRIKNTYKRAPLSATFVRGLFGPASTKEASNKPAENRDRRLKFNSDTIEHFQSYLGFLSRFIGLN